jgi:SprT protein
LPPASAQRIIAVILILSIPIAVMSLFKRLSQQLRSPQRLPATESNAQGDTVPQAANSPAASKRRLSESSLKISPEIISQCEAALMLRLQQAEQALQQSWPRPALRYTQRGKAAGTAHLQRWEIRLNPVLLVENQALFLHEVIAHELAHLLVFARHGRVAPHGHHWQVMMQQVFGLAPRVTHRLDISKLQGPLFPYRCACQEHRLSLRRHNKVQRGQSRYLCRHCGQILRSEAATDSQTSGHSETLTSCFE